MTLAIDLNADLGELPGAAGRASDCDILEHVTSCSIACGGHAGDAQSMTATLKAALVANVAAGAHPSYPDRSGFGRISLDMAPDALEASLVEQMTALVSLAGDTGVPLRHVKPHGALYNDASTNPAVASIVVQSVQSVFGDHMAIICQPGFALAEAARVAGLPILAEAFIDRAYAPDGTLRSRSQPGAVLETVAERVEQAEQIVMAHSVAVGAERTVAVQADTLCVHGDSPGAAETAHRVRAALEARGVAVRAPTGT